MWRKSRLFASPGNYADIGEMPKHNVDRSGTTSWEAAARNIALSSEEEAIPKLKDLADRARDTASIRRELGSEYAAASEPLPTSQSPDCPLEVARRIIAKEGQYQQVGLELRKQAFRLIANCCADETDPTGNRKLLMDRGLVTVFKQLIWEQKEDLSLLLPACYNICTNSVDEDEDAETLQGMVIRGEEQQPTGRSKVSLGERALGRPLEEPSLTTIEILLNIVDVDLTDTSPKVSPLLPDLILLASRPALLGGEHILPGPGPAHLSQSIALLEALSSRRNTILQGDSSLDTHLSLIEATLNILSQPLFQKAAISSDLTLDYLQQLSLLSEIDADDESLDALGASDKARAEDSLLKLVYQLTALPDYPHYQTPISPIVQQATIELTRFESREAIAVPHKWHTYNAMNCILIANTLTDPDRINSYLKSSAAAQNPLIPSLITILQTTTHTSLLLPALDLTIRLTHTPQGQTAAATHPPLFNAIHHLLTTTYPHPQLKIQTDAILLTRLLIRAQPPHAASLLKHPSLLSTILTLFASPAPQVKQEVSRLVVEVLRSNAKSPHEVHLVEGWLNMFIEPVVFQITTEAPTATRSEGVFGLALLMTLLIAQSQDGEALSLLFDVLQREREKLKEVFDAIFQTVALEKERENVRAVVMQLLSLREIMEGHDEMFLMLEEFKRPF